MTTGDDKYSVEKLRVVSILPMDIGTNYCRGLINPKGGGSYLCVKPIVTSMRHTGKGGCEIKSHMTEKMNVGYGRIYLTDVGDGFYEPCVKIGGLSDSSQKLISDTTHSCESWAHVVAGVSAFSLALSEDAFEIQLKNWEND